MNVLTRIHIKQTIASTICSKFKINFYLADVPLKSDLKSPGFIPFESYYVLHKLTVKASMTNIPLTFAPEVAASVTSEPEFDLSATLVPESAGVWAAEGCDEACIETSASVFCPTTAAVVCITDGVVSSTLMAVICGASVVVVSGIDVGGIGVVATSGMVVVVGIGIGDVTTTRGIVVVDIGIGVVSFTWNAVVVGIDSGVVYT